MVSLVDSGLSKFQIGSDHHSLRRPIVPCRSFTESESSAAILPLQNYNSQVCCMRLQSTVHIITSSPIVSVLQKKCVV